MLLQLKAFKEMEYIKKHLLQILAILVLLIYIMMGFLQGLIVKGTTLQIFDVMMVKGFDLAYVNTFLNQVSMQGKNVYLHLQIPLDFIFPVLMSLIFYLFFLKETNNKKIALFGFSSLIFDYAENIFVIIMLTSLNLSESTVRIASTITIIKGIMYLLNYGLLLFLLIRCRYRKGCPFKNKTKKTS